MVPQGIKPVLQRTAIEVRLNQSRSSLWCVCVSVCAELLSLSLSPPSVQSDLGVGRAKPEELPDVQRHLAEPAGGVRRRHGPELRHPQREEETQLRRQHARPRCGEQRLHQREKKNQSYRRSRDGWVVGGLFPWQPVHTLLMENKCRAEMFVDQKLLQTRRGASLMCSSPNQQLIIILE